MPPRRQATSPERSRSFDAVRDLLAFSCNPAEATGASLSGLDDEFADVQRAYPRAAQVKHMRNESANELLKELRDAPPRAFLFMGHADVQFNGGVRSLYFVDNHRNAKPVDPKVLARMLGKHSTARGGPLELVVINGCNSSGLAEHIRAEGVPNVVCWETCCENGAARIFTREFFGAMQDASFAAAFEHARDAIEIPTLRVKDAAGVPVVTKKYRIGDPALGPAPHAFPCAAGIPKLLTADDPAPGADESPPCEDVHVGRSADSWPMAAGMAVLLLPKRLLIDCLWGLLTGAERAAKLAIADRFTAPSPPLQLREVGLRPGDRIVTEVTIGFTRRVAWPATVRSATRVTWDPMPAVDQQYSRSYDGNIEFRLTHILGRTIYDRDEDLYYRWRFASADDAQATTHVAPERHEEGSSLTALVITCIARCLLIMIVFALLWGLSAAFPLLLRYLILPMVLQPVSSLVAVLACLFAAIVLPRVVRRLAEDEDEEHIAALPLAEPGGVQQELQGRADGSVE